LGIPARASSPDDETLNKVVALNEKALAAYASQDAEAAIALLGQALDLCKLAHLDTHPTAARTHIHLGVVLVSGIKKRALGLTEFRKAIAIDPKIRITKSLINPEAQGAFEEALIVGAIPLAEQAPPPVPAAQPDEPTIARGPAIHGINHPPVTEATRGRAVEIKAQVPPGLGATRVVLAYRAGDAAEFLAREMTPVEGAASWYHENIPAQATQGTRAAYYIEARNADDDAIARSGADDDAHFIALGRETSSDGGDGAKAGSEGAKPANEGDHGLWFVLAVGAGGGYYSGSPETNPQDGSTPPDDIRVSGFAMARLLHLAPEIGYFQSENLIVSAQGRFQYVTGVDDIQVGQKIQQPSRWGAAGLVKVTRLMAGAGGRFRPFVSAQAGAGQIRHSVTVACTTSTTCKDTVFGGLGLAGLGAGFTYRLRDGVSLYTAFNVLVGMPNLTVNGDLNIGVAVIR
jgi:hypothetical protein